MKITIDVWEALAVVSVGWKSCNMNIKFLTNFVFRFTAKFFIH